MGQWLPGLDSLISDIQDLFASKGMSPTQYAEAITAPPVAGGPTVNPYTGAIISPTSVPGGSSDTPTGGHFLFRAALVCLGVAAAPAIYAAYNAQKGPKKRSSDITSDGMFLALEGASNRATSLLAGILPAFAFPIAYIGIEELEEKRIISGALGDDVQALMTAGVLAPAVGNVIGSVVSAVAKGKKV